MPWQRMVVDVGCEIGDDGLPAYREVIATVMRQQGKSLMTFSVIGHRCTLWVPQPQRAIYTAQDGAAARKKLVEDAGPLYTLRRWPFSRLVRRVFRGVGNEGIDFLTGSTVRIIGSSEQAGHGITSTGLAVIDESFADRDNRREQALSPSMATVPDAQTWNVSTAGTDESVFLRRKIEMGRDAAESGRNTGIAYFEWSIPLDEDIDDPEVWWEFMPALGWTISPAKVAHDRETMTDGDFRRSWGNQWTTTSERAIPSELWERVRSDVAVPSGRRRLCVEVQPDRDGACVVGFAGGVVELVERRPGTSWVVDVVAPLALNFSAPVVVDGTGPAASLIPDLERAGVSLVKLGAREVTQACAAFYDAVAEQRILVRRHEAFDMAADAVVKRKSGDSWLWSRRAGRVDVTPIMAASLVSWNADGVREHVSSVVVDLNDYVGLDDEE